MAHYCTTSMKLLRHPWHASFVNACKRQMRPLELNGVFAHIKPFFDAHVVDPTVRTRVCVPINCPHNWPVALVPVWVAAGRDEEMAAMFLGGLYCEYAIKRPEMWCSAPLPFRQFSHGKARHYFLAPNLMLRAA